MNERGVRWVVGSVGLALAVASEAIQLQARQRPERVLIDLVVGLAFFFGGLFAWGREARTEPGKVRAP